MNLQFNKETVCPHCHCTEVVSESVEVDNYLTQPKVKEHVHGGRWEKREFLCGYACTYIPNYKKVEVVRPCTQAEGFKEREKLRTELRKQIRSLEEKLRSL
jgi:hypothetical protein